MRISIDKSLCSEAIIIQHQCQKELCCDSLINYIYINGNASKPHISKIHNIQETQTTVSKQTRNIVFATSIYAILIDFAFEF